MNQADGSLGFLMPRLYQIYENPTLYGQAFHDITAGNNSFGGITGYSAAKGWDPASGLGTPNAAGLATALSQTHPDTLDARTPAEPGRPNVTLQRHRPPGLANPPSRQIIEPCRGAHPQPTPRSSRVHIRMNCTPGAVLQVHQREAQSRQ